MTITKHRKPLAVFIPLGLAFGAVLGSALGDTTVGLGFGIALGGGIGMLLTPPDRQPMNIISIMSMMLASGLLGGYLLALALGLNEFTMAGVMLGAATVLCAGSTAIRLLQKNRIGKSGSAPKDRAAEP